MSVVYVYRIFQSRTFCFKETSDISLRRARSEGINQEIRYAVYSFQIFFSTNKQTYV